VYYGVVQIQREFIFYTALGFFALTQTLKCALHGSCSANLKFIPLDFGQCSNSKTASNSMFERTAATPTTAWLHQERQQ